MSNLDKIKAAALQNVTEVINNYQGIRIKTDPLLEEMLETQRIQSALDVQIGGNHYKSLKIQPMEYSMANKLDACQHTAIKYITRFRDKGGLADLDKAIHCIEMLKEFYRKEQE